MDDDFRAFAETGFGLAGSLGYALSDRWRLAGGLQWARHSGRSIEGDWTTVELFGQIGFDLSDAPRSDLLLLLGAGVMRLNPERDSEFVSGLTRGSIQGGVRFDYFVWSTVGFTGQARLVLAIPGDDIAGPDGAITLPMGIGVVVRFQP